MKGKTVLVVDDMHFDREVITRAIVRKLECRVVEAQSGEEALALISTKQFDMVLLDIEMPTMSGDSVLVKIRELRGHEELPVIMVSGKSQDAVVARCLKAGANDYITKPINFEIALTRISSHLKLAESIKHGARLQELAALNAIVTTYNHEINNPLAIAFGCLSRLEKDSSDDLALKKIKGALERITDILRKISTATEKGEANYETYSVGSKILKIK